MNSILQQLCRLRDGDLRHLSEAVHEEIRKRNGTASATETSVCEAADEESATVPAPATRTRRPSTPRRAA
jgi:hypothetical protein